MHRIAAPNKRRKLVAFMVTGLLLAFTSGINAQEQTAETEANEGWFHRWWTSDSALPVIDVRTEKTLGRKLQRSKSSAIPETSLRNDLADAGFSFFGNYTGFFLGNLSGGKEQWFTYNHMLFVQLNFDMEKLVGWQGGTFVWSFADNAGSNLSKYVGNNFQISTDYGPNTFMFNEMYVMQSLLEDKLTIKLGYMSMLNDFLASPLYDYYSNLAFCGNPIALALNTPATAMPQSSWGANVKYAVPEWYIQAGVYQVTSRLGQIPYHGADYSIRPGDGTMMFLEGGLTPTLFKEKVNPATPLRDGKATVTSKNVKDFKKVEDVTEVGYPGHYKLGAFLSNWEFAKFSDGSNVPNIYGFYVLADQMVYREPGSSKQGLYLWSAFVVTPQEDIANVPYYVSGGIQYEGLIPTRDSDRAIFGVGYGSYSNDLAGSQRAAGQPAEDYEMVMEWAYQIRINPWFTIQPDLQYIVNPGATHTLNNAWVLGALVSVSF